PQIPPPPRPPLVPYTTLFRSLPRLGSVLRNRTEHPVRRDTKPSLPERNVVALHASAEGAQQIQLRMYFFAAAAAVAALIALRGSDRKSTRLNSSHVKISYAVF